MPELMFGGWGRPPGAQAVEFGPHRFGIELKFTRRAEGEKSTEACLLLPWAGGFSVAWRGETEDNDAGVCGRRGAAPCHALVSALGFAPGDNPDYYDLLVEILGTRFENGAIEDVSGTRHLRFDNGRYF